MASKAGGRNFKMKVATSSGIIKQQKRRHHRHNAHVSLRFSTHGYLKPLDTNAAAGYCKRCARRSLPCLKCSYCLLCHPFKEAEERTANDCCYHIQTSLRSFVQEEQEAEVTES